MPKIEFGASEMKPLNPSHVDGDAILQDAVHESNGPTFDISALDPTDEEMTDVDSSQSMPEGSDSYDHQSVVSTNIIAITKTQLTSGSSPRYMFIVKLKWTDGELSYIARDHDDFFRYHCWLLDTFREEAGHSKSSRTIPLFPGKKWFRNDMRLAEERKPLIQAYLNDVIKLQRISESRPAQTFFRRRPGDPNDDDPLLKNENLAESEVADFEENLKLVIDQESSKGSQQQVPIEANGKENFIKGSHSNENFQPDDDDDADAIKTAVNDSKEEEMEQPSQANEAKLEATSVL